MRRSRSRARIIDNHHLLSGVFIRWNGTVEWNGGMEWWNGTVEWNSGMEWWNSGTTTPTDRVLSRPIPTIFQDTAVFSSHGKQVVSVVLKKTSSI